ncbi:MAG: hypothetical protein ACYCVZ_15510, partial [Streptosporangiaceae bacterium]
MPVTRPGSCTRTSAAKCWRRLVRGAGGDSPAGGAADCEVAAGDADVVADVIGEAAGAEPGRPA